MSESFNYDKRGVSATKDEVHAAIRHLDKGLFPNAFCKVIPDIAAGDPDFCNVMHADTAGTKTSLAYLYWKETGDPGIWAGIAQDALVMNLDDMACVGCVGDIVLSSTIGRNKNRIPGEVISALIDGTQAFIERMRAFDVQLFLAGGETADVGDIVRTLDVGFTAFARMKRSEVIVNNIQPGDVVIGLASFGRTTYEDRYNGGMGSNGLTSARHDVLSKFYAGAFPESFDPATPEEVVYVGSKRLTDLVEVAGEQLTVGQLLLSPTRTYLPFLRPLIREFRPHLHGLIHCTGGGQTKVTKFIDGVKVVKDNLFALPPLFQLIQEQSGTGWREMYQVFNMGHRLEIYVKEEWAEPILQLAAQFDLDARLVGRVEKAGRPEVEIRSPFGSFVYF